MATSVVLMRRINQVLLEGVRPLLAGSFINNDNYPYGLCASALSLSLSLSLSLGEASLARHRNY